MRRGNLHPIAPPETTDAEGRCHARAEPRGSVMQPDRLDRIDLRAPHRAFRDIVTTDGDAAPRYCFDAAERFIGEHFAGELELPFIMITEVSPRSWGDAIPVDVHGVRSRIRIAPRAVREGQRFAEDVVLHELIHVWQYEVVHDREPGYRGHGPGFATKCNEIGEKLGLPPVYARPRGKNAGKPDCKHWPHNVRPAGYYGDDTAEDKAKPDKPKKVTINVEACLDAIRIAIENVTAPINDSVLDADVLVRLENALDYLVPLTSHLKNPSIAAIDPEAKARCRHRWLELDDDEEEEEEETGDALVAAGGDAFGAGEA